jgi:hypothetical protein
MLDEEPCVQGDFLMAVRDPSYRIGAHLLLTLALSIPCLVVGCGGEGSSKPAPVDGAQEQKVQQYFGGYKQQLIAEAKKQAVAKAQAKNAEAKSP